MENSNNEFNFFVPINTIEKAKNDKGEEVMKICGVASTPEIDVDDQYLDPSGFDLSFFKSNGFINWNHQAKKDPAYYIGEPTEGTRITSDNKLWIEGELWPESDLAKSVYGLANTLKRTKSKRKLGYSVEGKAIDGIKNDKGEFTKITKALITSVAITPAPKNPGTWLEIVKGHLNGPAEYEFEKGETSGNGGEITLIDITDEKGNRIVVDKELNIKITKALSSTSGAALRKEDLEGGLKNLVGNERKDKLEEAATVIVKAFEEGLIDDSTFEKAKNNFKILYYK